MMEKALDNVGNLPYLQHNICICKLLDVMVANIRLS